MPSNVQTRQHIQHGMQEVLLKKIIKFKDEQGRDETKHGVWGNAAASASPHACDGYLR